MNELGRVGNGSMLPSAWFPGDAGIMPIQSNPVGTNERTNIISRLDVHL